MRRPSLSLIFPTVVAALVGLAVLAPRGYSQAGTNGSDFVIVSDGSPAGQKLARYMAANRTSFVPPSTPAGDVIAEAGNRTAVWQPLALAVPPGLRYFITDIGTLGGTQSLAYAINDLGQVVGDSRLAGDLSSHSFLYSNRKMIDLYPIDSQAVRTGSLSINNASQIASGVIASGVYVPAVLDAPTGLISLIGHLGGVTSYGFNGVATSINNRGSVVGYSYIDGVNRHAFLCKNGVFSDIDSFGGYSGAMAINDAGLIVGFASDQSNGVAHAFAYVDGVTTKIRPSTESYARSVNNLGEVIGEFLTDDGKAFHPFLYSHGTFTDISVPGVGEMTAYAINDQSQIVGTTNYAGSQYAYLYKDRVLFDLNTVIPQDFGWKLFWALDINNLGQIAGSGLIHGEYRAFVLTPATTTDQCMNSGWTNFGFQNLGQCIQFVNSGK